MEQKTNRLDPWVTELMADFEEHSERLTMSDDKFRYWRNQIRKLKPSARVRIATDLAVVAARFQREAAEATEWAVAALMFFGVEMVGNIETARRCFEAEGLKLTDEAKKFVNPSETLKKAPYVQAGRTQKIDPEILRRTLQRLR